MLSCNFFFSFYRTITSIISAPGDKRPHMEEKTNVSPPQKIPKSKSNSNRNSNKRNKANIHWLVSGDDQLCISTIYFLDTLPLKILSPSMIRLRRTLSYAHRKMMFDRVKTYLPNMEEYNIKLSADRIPEGLIMPFILGLHENVAFNPIHCLATMITSAFEPGEGLIIIPTKAAEFYNFLAASSIAISGSSTQMVLMIPCLKFLFNIVQLAGLEYENIIQRLQTFCTYLRIHYGIVTLPEDIRAQAVWENKNKYYNLLKERLPAVNTTLTDMWKVEFGTTSTPPSIQILPNTVINVQFQSVQSGTMSDRVTRSIVIENNDIELIIDFARKTQHRRLFFKPTIACRSVGGFDINFVEQKIELDVLDVDTVRAMLIEQIDSSIFEHCTSIQYIVQPFNPTLSTGEHRFYYLLDNAAVPYCVSSVTTRAEPGTNRGNWKIGNTKPYEGLHPDLVDKLDAGEQIDANLIEPIVSCLFTIPEIGLNIHENEMIRFDCIAVRKRNQAKTKPAIRMIIINEITTCLDVGCFQHIVPHDVLIPWAENMLARIRILVAVQLTAAPASALSAPLNDDDDRRQHHGVRALNFSGFASQQSSSSGSKMNTSVSTSSNNSMSSSDSSVIIVHDSPGPATIKNALVPTPTSPPTTTKFEFALKWINASATEMNNMPSKQQIHDITLNYNLSTQIVYCTEC